MAPRLEPHHVASHSHYLQALLVIFERKNGFRRCFIRTTLLVHRFVVRVQRTSFVAVLVLPWLRVVAYIVQGGGGVSCCASGDTTGCVSSCGAPGSAIRGSGWIIGLIALVLVVVASYRVA
eukprot:499458_1